MNLSVLDRLSILTVLPNEGNYATLKILMNLRLSLSFTEEETKEWDIISDVQSGRTSWAVDGEADVPIGEKATDMIVDAFKKMDSEQKLTPDMLGAYEKFITTE